MVGIPADLSYLRSLATPMYHLFKDHQRRGVLSRHESRALADVVESSTNVELSARRLLREIHAHAGATEGFLRQLSPSTRALLPAGGLILEVEPGTKVMIAGRVERDLYVILSGDFVMRLGASQQVTLGPGEVFGGLDFFRPNGQRNATVTALNKGRLLALRHRFLRNLEKSAPTAALEIYKLLAERLAARVAEFTGEA